MALNRHTVLCGIMLLCGYCSAYPRESFEESWRWTHFTVESGLPSNTVVRIYETSDSTIWAATPSGVASFDGYEWHALEKKFMNIDGEFRGAMLLRNNDSLFLFHDGSLRFVASNVKTSVPLSSDSIVIQRNGKLELLLFDSSGDFQTHEMVQPPNLNRVFRTRTGDFWAEAENALYRFKVGKWNRVFSSSFGELVLGGGSPGYGQIQDNAMHAGLFYVLRPHEIQGLWEWSDVLPPKRIESEKPEVINAMDIGPQNQAIAVYRPNAVRYRENGVWRTISFEQYGIDDILSAYFRSNGDLLLGTGHGLYRFSRAPGRWQSVQHPAPDMRNSVNAILRARDGTLWVATSDGIETYSPDGNYTYVNRIDTTHLYALTGLGEDSNGNIWISSGSSFTGAFRWDKINWRHFDIGENPKSVAIHKIQKDREGNLWFLGIGISPRLFPKGQPGAFLLRNNGFERWGEQEGLLHGRVYSFAESKDGSLWFGTINGLSRWRPSLPMSSSSKGSTRIPSNGTWKYWKNASGSGDERVFALTIDHSDRTWFAAWGTNTGFGYIDNDDSVHFYPGSSALLYKFVYDLCGDDSGAVWLATDAGLYQVRNDLCLNFNTKSGLQYHALYCLFRFGPDLYIGTQGKGFAILNTSIPVSAPPRIRLEQPVVENQNAFVRWTAFPRWGELAPAEALSRFRLNNGPWTDWDKRSSISLSNLDPGEYSIQIQAKGLYGQYDASGTNASFLVLPPLYLRPLVLYPGLVGLTGLTCLSVILLWRKRKYDRSIRISEERYRMITELMSDFAYLIAVEGADNAAIVWLTESFTRITGFTIDEAKTPGFFHTFVCREDESLAQENIGRLLQGTPCEIELRIETKKNAQRWMRFYAIPIQDKASQRVTHVYGIARDITRRKNDEEQLRKLATELSQTEEQERRRMANFLHDVVSQSLVISKRKIDALQETREFSSAFEKSISDISELLQSSIDNTRALTFDLCPPILYDLGLAPAIDWLSEQMKGAHDITVRFDDDGEAKPLSSELRNMLYTGTRELLINVIKHAEAKNIWIDLRRSDGEVVLAVEDDGIGFDPGQSNSGNTLQQANGGFGLSNLRERFRYLGGRVDIESTKGKGTRATLTAPVQKGSNGDS